MKKNLLTVGFLAFALSASAQVLVHVDKDAVFYVGENALVYSGGGIQTKDNGVYDIHGNMMVVGNNTDVIRTLNSTGTADKTDGGNIILRYNNIGDLATSTTGQFFIDGLPQGNITGIVDKEFKNTQHGTYQQIAIPFHNKMISSLSSELGKTFTNIRRSQNEILTWDNARVEASFLDIASTTPKGTSYYMVGTKGMNFGVPPYSMPVNAPGIQGSVFTFRGVPLANGITETLTGAGDGVNFGVNGNGINSYNEKYNSYLQDNWDYNLNPTAPYTIPTFGRNIYQFGNPYLTNLDLKYIGVLESGITDGNDLSEVKGIRFDPGGVVSLPNGATYSLNASFVNFDPTTNIPAGDVGLVIKPMQTFVIKMRDNNPEVGADRTLSFDGLRRFKYYSRFDGVDYNVTAAKGSTSGTLKQLGVIGLNAEGKEIARTYYIVSPNSISGHTTNETVQSTLGSQNILGTYEEDAINGGYDMNYYNSYWLYINEANENDFKGKAVPLALYSNEIKALKFEIRENTKLIEENTHELSTGIGFYYKSANGEIMEIGQNEEVIVTGDQYSLYYGKPTTVLGADGVLKPSRSRVVYNQAVDGFFVKFDPNWKKADIQVFDMSGKLIISQKNVLTNTDFDIKLPKKNIAYIVTAVSENGEKMSSKIIR